MKYKSKIEVPEKDLKAYEEMLPYGEKELIEAGIPRLENVKTWTCRFENGNEADIKVNTSEDDVWTEGVLFDKDGNELCHTEVCDDIQGEWDFEFDGDTYEVEVIGL